MSALAAQGDPAERVVAVVVAWQRRELLAEALAAITAQTRPPDVVVVIDNASTDGSADVAREVVPDADVVSLSRNTGGAGGFAAGIALALVRHQADLVWLMDDDTVATPTALAELLAARRRHGGAAVVASRVVWHDGRDHPMNTPRARPLAGRVRRRRAAAAGCVPVRSASFVSVLVQAAAVRTEGLPLAAYFLWNDDFEFTTRLLRRRNGLWCPTSVVEHRTRTFGASDADPGQRFALEVRNKVWLFTRSPALGPLDRAIYGASTLRRWVRTVVRSADRGTLLRCLVEGLRDGVMSAPAATSAVLADLPEVAAEVAAVETAALDAAAVRT